MLTFKKVQAEFMKVYPTGSLEREILKNKKMGYSVSYSAESKIYYYTSANLEILCERLDVTNFPEYQKQKALAEANDKRMLEDMERIKNEPNIFDM